jgi:hypothetical protein
LAEDGRKDDDRRKGGAAMTPDDIRADRPERIWAFTVDDCDFENEDEYRLNVPFWHEKKPVFDATEYIRADLHTAQIAALEAENKRLRDGIAYVLSKHPYGRLKRLMGDVLDGKDPEKTEGSESRWNDRVSAAEAKARRADWALSKIMDALKEASAIVGDKP